MRVFSAAVLLLCGFTLNAQSLQGIAGEEGASFNRTIVEERKRYGHSPVR
jgi:hypothetical protein